MDTTSDNNITEPVVDSENPSKIFKKKSLRKQLQNVRVSSDDSPMPTSQAAKNSKLINDFLEHGICEDGDILADKQKKRARRRLRKPKEPKEPYKVDERASSSKSTSTPLKKINNYVLDPNHDILDLQTLYLTMNGVTLNESKPDSPDSPDEAVTQEPVNNKSLNNSGINGIQPITPMSKECKKVNASLKKSKGGNDSLNKSIRRRRTDSYSNNGEKVSFENYLTKEEVLEGLKNKSLFEGSIRINPKCYQQAYIGNPDKKKKDIIINGIKHRNRALDDDVVVIETIDPPGGGEKLTGKVVYIKEYKHSRTCIGNVKMNFGKKNEVYFYPRDKRMPIMSIPLIDCPPAFEREHKRFENTLFLAKIVNWLNPKFSIGTLLANVGQSHDLKTQTKAILLENDLDIMPFGSEFKHLYPNSDFIIPEEELKYREDFRNCCVFTIDPLTARDLDDAVSCRLMDNGNYEIGVHISDVAYYLKEDTDLDDLVANKATTVYLVDGTYHMLPRDLCFHCSLLPGSDKLTFSVIWEISKDGKVLNHRFTRSIINNCVQLAYEHAQVMLDNPGKDLNPEDFPKIEGPWTLTNIKDIVKILFNLSAIFRSKRFKGGALRIDQPKLMFKLDADNGFPMSYRIEEHNESHSLIEEFMLLANCTVAARIYQDFPSLAFLRLHPPPKNTLEAVAENFHKIGIDLDISSAGQLQSSLATYAAGDLEGQAKAMVLHTHLIKTLARALYFCAEGHDQNDMRHYSLNIPLYTHFTSPIRRYADVIVHRYI